MVLLDFFCCQIPKHFSRIPYSYRATFGEQNFGIGKLNDFLCKLPNIRTSLQVSAQVLSSEWTGRKSRQLPPSSSQRAARIMVFLACHTHCHVLHNSVYHSICVAKATHRLLSLSEPEITEIRCSWKSADHMHKCFWHYSTKFRVCPPKVFVTAWMFLNSRHSWFSVAVNALKECNGELSKPVRSLLFQRWSRTSCLAKRIKWRTWRIKRVLKTVK